MQLQNSSLIFNAGVTRPASGAEILSKVLTASPTIAITSVTKETKLAFGKALAA